jgi:hypothetical protein
MIQFYRVYHEGCNDSLCLGNPQVIKSENLVVFRELFDNWTINDDGTVFSTGDEEWRATNKTFHATPIVEDDDALTIEQRISPFTLSDLLVPFPNYWVTIEPDWDLVPKAVKESPECMANLEDARKKNFDYLSVVNFIVDSQVVNVKISDYHIVSGYSALEFTQYQFTPKYQFTPILSN